MSPPSNYFDFFGLPHKLNLDSKDLESRFYALSKQWHPDRFARGSAEQRLISEDATATLNDGYRTLREPVARAEYVLKEHGFDTAEQKSSTVPPELLEEVFELNMALEEAETSGPQLEEARQKFVTMREDIDRELFEQFAAYDETQERAALERIRGILNRRNYIRNLVTQVEQALSTGQVRQALRHD
jgi:molecular chaperone HscB